jgi:hypothetical protein
MEMKTACGIVQDFADSRGLGLLEGLEEMGQHLDYISEREVIAYRMFMRAGQQMMAPREEPYSPFGTVGS